MKGIQESGSSEGELLQRKRKRSKRIRKSTGIMHPYAKIISTKGRKTTTKEILLYIPSNSLLLQMTWTNGGRGSLETMHLDGGFLQAILDEEGRDLGTLVSLELNDLAHFLIVDKSAVTSEFLLEGL